MLFAKIMASCDAGQYWCSICHLKFPFQSKLDRHIASEDHKIFASIVHNVDVEVDLEDVDMGSLSPLRQTDDLDSAEPHCHQRGSADADTDSTDDNSDDDVDIDALLHECAMEEDYSPFPNKMFALLYCLLNSPKPIGESNLKFVWFVVGHTGIVPSISAIKKFKLPGLVPPTRHIASKGEPFYMNSLSSIVRRFIGNPHTSKMVQRFPVISKGHYREMFHACRWHFILLWCLWTVVFMSLFVIASIVYIQFYTKLLL